MKRGEVEITLTGPARVAAVLDALFPEFTGEPCRRQPSTSGPWWNRQT